MLYKNAKLLSCYYYNYYEYEVSKTGRYEKQRGEDMWPRTSASMVPYVSGEQAGCVCVCLCVSVCVCAQLGFATLFCIGSNL